MSEVQIRSDNSSANSATPAGLAISMRDITIHHKDSSFLKIPVSLQLAIRSN
jgi:hypothetical protein